jgi:hypothetical protein
MRERRVARRIRQALRVACVPEAIGGAAAVIAPSALA